MGPALVCVADPDVPSAETAISALAHAAFEKECAILVRYVRASNSSPKLFAMLPSVKHDWEGFWMLPLPFADDVRDYIFRSLPEKFPSKAEEAMDNLIAEMDLMEAATDDAGDTKEAFVPKETFHPGYHRIYQCTRHRILHPHDKELPPMESHLAQQLNPLPAVRKRSGHTASELKTLFKLERIDEQIAEAQKKIWGDSK